MRVYHVEHCPWLSKAKIHFPRLISSICGVVLGTTLACGLPGTSYGQPVGDQETDDGSGDHRTIGGNAVQSRWSAAYGKLPMRFEPLTTTAGAATSFVAAGQGYRFMVSPTEVILSLRSTNSTRVSKAFSEKVPSSYRFARLTPRPRPERAMITLKLLQANAQAIGSGLSPLAGCVHRLLGNDTHQWTTEIQTYAQVQYTEIYPGIDVVYYGNQRNLEFDFRIQPGAHPEAIRFGYEGVSRVEVDAEGNLLLYHAGGLIGQPKPVLYQENQQIRQLVTGGYVVDAEQQVSFHVGAYDPNLPLIIDPVLSYATYLGGSSMDQGWDIAVDANGNAYIAGETDSVNFNTLISGAFTNYAGSVTTGGDAFVAKLNPAGTALVYFTYLGGRAEDTAFRIAVDANGSAYIAGVTASPNFPVANAAQRIIGGVANADGVYPYDGFIAKLNPAGSALVYSTYLGGSGADEILDLAVDTGGNAYVTGHTSSSNFPLVNSIMKKTGDQDVFVTKLSATGKTLVYSTLIGGNDADSGEAIVVDGAGNAYVGGQTYSGNFPQLNALQRNLAGERDAFLCKLNAAGSQLIFSTFIGGAGLDRISRIALDSDRNIFITGQTYSADFPLVHSQQPKFGGKSDAFVAKLSSDGQAYLFSTFLGGSGTESGWALGLDGEGNVFVVGNTFSTNFPTVNPLQGQLNGDEDVFIAEYTPNGATVTYATYLGGNSFDNAYGMAVDAGGTVYLAGGTYSDAGLSMAGHAWQSNYRGGTDDGDGWVAKILPSPILRISYTSKNLSLSWPATQPAYQLQATDNPIASSAWIPDRTTLSLLKGRYTVTKLPNEKRKFYRLVGAP